MEAAIVPSRVVPDRRSVGRRWRSALRLLAAVGGGVVLAAGSPAARQERSQSQLLQDGTALIETKGDYRGAARVFEKVTHGPDRALQAQGYLYLGRAEELLDKAAARAAYETIISRYGDRPVIVAQARVRLARLDAARVNPLAREKTKRRLWGSDFTPLGPPARMGRSLPGSNMMGELAVRDLDTLEISSLGPNSTGDGLTAALFSPDASQVASMWEVSGPPASTYEVRVSAASGGRPRTVLRRPAVDGKLAGWTRDGRALVVYFVPANGAGEIVTIDLATENTKVVARLGARVSWTIALSPDGALIVFDVLAANGRVDQDIHIVDVATGRAGPLIDHQANDVFPSWTADGRVLFASDRTGSLGLWLVDLENSRAAGEPQLVYPEIGTLVPPIGLDPNGSLYFRLQEGLVDVKTSTLDPTRGAASPPVRVSRRVEGSDLFPDWSPDGRRVVYISRRSQLPFSPRGTALVVSDVQTGEERVLTFGVPNPGMPRWSPDGRWIAVLTSSDNAAGLNRVDADSAAIESLARTEPGQPRISTAEWTPDGRGLVYARGFGLIVRRDLQNGREQTVYEAPKGMDLGKPTLSHDGSRLAVEQSGDTPKQLVIVPVVGGAARTIYAADARERFEVAGWSAGDADVFIVAWPRTPSNAPRSLLRVPLNGGSPVATGLAVPTMRDVRVSPDGLRVAFTSGLNTRAAFVLENFLPPPRTAAAPRPPPRQPDR